EQAMVPIQTLIARIDSEVGDLNRTVGDAIAASQVPTKAFQQIGVSTSAANRTITSIVERMKPNQAAPGGAGIADPLADLRQISVWVTELYDARSEFNEAVRILNSERRANHAEAIKSRR